MAKTAKKRRTVISVEDLSGVDSRLPAGIYTVKIASAHAHKVNVAGVMWVFEVIEGEYEGSKTREHFTSAEGPGRYRLKQLLRAADYKLEDGDFDMDLDELIDRELSIEVADREYVRDDGSPGIASDVVGYIKLGDVEEEEKPKAKKAKAKSRKADEEEEEEEEEPKPRSRRKAKEEPEEEEEEEEKPARGRRKAKEEPEEEEEKPSRRSSKKKKAALTEDDINDMDTSELEELVEEHELDVDLSKLRTLSKQRAAVIKAAGDLLE